MIHRVVAFAKSYEGAVTYYNDVYRLFSPYFGRALSGSLLLQLGRKREESALSLEMAFFGECQIPK